MARTIDINILCDGCKKTIRGREVYNADGDIIATSMFYRRSGPWGDCMEEGEELLCDECMQARPKYKAKTGSP